jgi:sugar phosphate isomerase/epimerase
MITRRTALAATAGAFLARPALSAETMRTIGGAPAGFPVRTRAARQRGQPFDVVGQCHSLGLGVVETRLPSTDPAAVAALRNRIEDWGMRLILDVGYPRDEAGVADFEARVKAAKECGAVSLHAAMTGRRYEDLDSLDAFKRDFARCRNSIALAEPVLRRHRIRLGIENHKGWRSAEQAAWLHSVGSEWVGVHFDFGNNLSLCEDPAETLRNLLPFAVACHLKDMAAAPYEDGFLLSEVPLGEGVLDLPAMAAALRAHDRDIPLDLEIITRDPLKIPVFTDKYWVTFDDSFSPLPGRDLAHTLELVRKRGWTKPLPHLAGLTPEQQSQLEEDSIARSLEYARKHLAAG